MIGRRFDWEHVVVALVVGAAMLFAAVPSLAGRLSPGADEAAVVRSLRWMAAPELASEFANGAGFAELAAARRISSRFAAEREDGTVDTGGYRYRVSRLADGRWRIHAWPVEWREGREPSPWDRFRGRLGTTHTRRAFSVDESGTVRGTDNGARRYVGDDAPPVDAVERDGERWVPLPSER